MPDDHNAMFQQARYRYTIVQMGVMGTLFAVAFIGSMFLPLELEWRLGYGVLASMAVLGGVYLTRWVLNRRLSALHRRLYPAHDPESRGLEG